MTGTKPIILTVAGSDSGAGAGIQADIKTISALGGYCVSAITALTAKSGLGVFGIMPSSPEFLDLQLNVLLRDFPVRAVKTGMLFSSELISVTAGRLRQNMPPLILDPVCVAKSGHHLLQPEAISALRRELLPLAALVTPNLPEAELIADMTMQDRDIPSFVRECADRLLDMGAGGVLIKGGHFPFTPGHEEEMADWLVLPGQDPLPMSHPRVNTPNSHGTGCALSAGIAAGLGRGLDMIQAIQAAQDYIVRAMRESYAPGLGIGPLNHLP